MDKTGEIYITKKNPIMVSLRRIVIVLAMLLSLIFGTGSIVSENSSEAVAWQAIEQTPASYSNSGAPQETETVTVELEEEEVTLAPGESETVEASPNGNEIEVKVEKESWDSRDTIIITLSSIASLALGFFAFAKRKVINVFRRSG